MNDKYDWKKKREKNAYLALEDGTVFEGVSFGAPADREGELVFNTGLTGYQEILSDPSYAGQFVTMTYPEIGNTGINSADMESRGLFANGFIVHEYNEPSNWRSEESLSSILKRLGIPGIAGIDTRALTLMLRSSGTMKGYISCSGKVSVEEAVSKARQWPGLDNQDYVKKVSVKSAFEWDKDGALSSSWGLCDKLPPIDCKIVAYDFGIKWNILRFLRLSGMGVKVVPAKTSAEDVLAMKPDGVFLSNGPADPAALSYAIQSAKSLIGKLPIMGICLGHQILGLAYGGQSYRLKFGHHGCNHPVKNLETGMIEITSQNHNFAIVPESLPKCIETTHLNLNDSTLEGMRHKKEPVFSVQYHPEAAPGPHDSRYLFDSFRKLIGR